MKEREGDDPDHLVPSEWVGDICAIANGGCDTGKGKYGFTRDFGTFFATLIFTSVYFFVFHNMKKKETAHTDNDILKILVCTFAFLATEAGLNLFGILGFNPLISTIIVIFKVSQSDGSASPYAHYLWAYIIAPMVASFIGAVLHLLHVKASNKNGGGSTDYD